MIVGGLGSERSVSTAQNSLQFYDDVSFSRGRNTLKFGFNYERLNGYTHASPAQRQRDLCDDVGDGHRACELSAGAALCGGRGADRRNERR